jgi:hypothetical protein
MGTSTLLDIIGATFVGGLLILILFRLNDNAVENNYMYSGELRVQENLVSVVALLENDFRKIGYCKVWDKIADPTKAVLSADSTSIRFLTDEDNNGIVDTMRYYLGPASELNMTANLRDRLLYRVVNHQTPKGVNLGVTQFRLLYFNALGNAINFPILVPGEIYTMQINITVEDIAGYNQQYSSSFWRQIRLVARNLRNR